MPFLLPSQQRQSTEGNMIMTMINDYALYKSTHSLNRGDILCELCDIADAFSVGWAAGRASNQ